VVSLVQSLQSESMKTSHPNGVCRIVIPSSLSLTRQIQDQVESALETHQFPEHDRFSVRLALEEALVNAMKHGNQLDPKKQVNITYHIHGGEFTIYIQDEGRGFNPEEVPDPKEPENLERDCGRGLLLMRHYMNEVVYHHPGNAVSMKKIASRCMKETER
jgi:serine/threonine-protein kinase RsbW